MIVTRPIIAVKPMRPLKMRAAWKEHQLNQLNLGVKSPKVVGHYLFLITLYVIHDSETGENGFFVTRAWIPCDGNFTPVETNVISGDAFFEIDRVREMVEYFHEYKEIFDFGETMELQALQFESKFHEVEEIAEILFKWNEDTK